MHHVAAKELRILPNAALIVGAHVLSVPIELCLFPSTSVCFSMW